MAAISNLYIDQGTDYIAIVTVNDANGDPLNLSGYTIAAQMRKSYGSLTGYTFATAIHDANTGQISIALTGVASSLIRPGRYLYDIEIKSDTLVKTRVAEGLVILTPEITRI